LSYNWIKIFRTSGQGEAEIIKGRLQAEGIPVFEQKGKSAFSTAHLGANVEADDILVPEEFVEKAREILFG